MRFALIAGSLQPEYQVSGTARMPSAWRASLIATVCGEPVECPKATTWVFSSS
jgi:hypothetical protein